MGYLTWVQWNMYQNLKKNNLRLFLVCGFFVLSAVLSSQPKKEFKVMFYNVENLFDHIDDPLTMDEEFTPDGVRHWTAYKATQKINKIARVIIAAGEFSPVNLIGMAEVENQGLLEALVKRSPLKKYGYHIIHRESDDRRGIDVALLYDPKAFKPLINRFIKVKVASEPSFVTRDILYSKAMLQSGDTLHVFVNHWPSRYGGVVQSKPLRAAAARALRHVTDSILLSSPTANIIIMGDFNDYPTDESIAHVLGAGSKGSLINLCGFTQEPGSYKYEGRWGFLDQFIVSNALYKRQQSGFRLVSELMVVRADFMLEPDNKYTGVKPYRTFNGYAYHGGYSDHLPILIILN